MKKKEELQKKLEELLKDERIHYKPATVFANAPLALIQTEIEVQIRTLCFVLEIPVPKLMQGK